VKLECELLLGGRVLGTDGGQLLPPQPPWSAGTLERSLDVETGAGTARIMSAGSVAKPAAKPILKSISKPILKQGQRVLRGQEEGRSAGGIEALPPNQDGLVVRSCTSHPGILGSIPNERNQGPVLKYRVPHGSQLVVSHSTRLTITVRLPQKATLPRRLELFGQNQNRSPALLFPLLHFIHICRLL
jgi:hypothetical protein